MHEIYAPLSPIWPTRNVGALATSCLPRCFSTRVGIQCCSGRCGSQYVPPRAIAAFTGTFILVIVLHALWDGIGGVLAYLVLAVLSLGLLRRALRRPAPALTTGPRPHK